MDVIAVLINALVVVIIFFLVLLISNIPIVGSAFEFISELSSAPRFVYLAWPFICSKKYRYKIVSEHKRRRKWLAWTEYCFASIVFVVVCIHLFLAIHRYVTKLLIDGSSF